MINYLTVKTDFNLDQPKRQKTTFKRSKFKDPLIFIKLSSLAISLLQIYLIQLDISDQLSLNLMITIGLYAFFYSLLFCNLKILIIRKVRARSVCLLWSWFELIQSIPLLVGVTISGMRTLSTKKKAIKLNTLNINH